MAFAEWKTHVIKESVELMKLEIKKIEVVMEPVPSCCHECPAKVELSIQHSEIVHKIDELQKYVTYNNTIFQPRVTDWYSVVRRSGTYKTLFRDRALFDVGTGKWGGPETDPVIYWLHNIPLPED